MYAHKFLVLFSILLTVVFSVATITAQNLELGTGLGF